LGAVPVAIYAFALEPPTKIKDLFKSLGDLALPKFSERPIEDIKKMMWSKLFKIEIVAAGIVALYILIAPTVYGLLFPNYLEAVIYSQVLVVTSLFIFPSLLLHTALLAKMEKNKLYFYRIGLPIINITLILVLLPAFGLWGAVGAFMGTKMFEFAMLANLFYRSY
jgi:O-antigen/teichoic acid export membrane protein